MTFRKITFIFIALLLSLLFLLQFWLIQNFTKDVSSKIGEAAFEVSRSTIETLVFGNSNIQFKKLALSKTLSQTETIEILGSVLKTPTDINISLNDGQKDTYLTINSSGLNHKVAIPRTGIENSLEKMSNKIFLSAMVFIFIGLIVATFFSRRLSSPLKELEIASEKVGQGDFGVQVVARDNFQSIEIKNTIKAFNKMSKKIALLQKENEILQKQSQLAELSEITRGLAHTIRNPLNTLNLAIDQLVESDNDRSKKELSKISKHQIRRIDKWVRSLMDVMSSEQNLVEEVSLFDLLKNCVQELSINKSSKIQVILNLSNTINENNLNTSIKANENELKSLLQSLVSNAIEATEEALNETDSPNSQHTSSNKPLIADNIVSIILDRKNDHLEVTITDRGLGFAPEIKRKLFSPHNTNKTYGAGMGLYLAHRVISLKYQGDLTVYDNKDYNKMASSKTNYGRGSTLVLTLKDRV